MYCTRVGRNFLLALTDKFAAMFCPWQLQTNIGLVSTSFSIMNAWLTVNRYSYHARPWTLSDRAIREKWDRWSFRFEMSTIRFVALPLNDFPAIQTGMIRRAVGAISMVPTARWRENLKILCWQTDIIYLDSFTKHWKHSSIIEKYVFHFRDEILLPIVSAREVGESEAFSPMSCLTSRLITLTLLR